MTLRNLLVLNLLALGLLLGGRNPTHAAGDKKTDPTGKWTFAVKTQDGQEIKISIKLKKEGEKLTGTFNVFDMDFPVEKGECKDGKVNFEVSPEVNGNKSLVKFTGDVDGDTFKGKYERDVNGEKVLRDFEAKREK